MRRRWILTLLPVLGALALLAACGGGPAGEESPSPSPENSQAAGQESESPGHGAQETPSPGLEEDEPRLTAVLYLPNGAGEGFDTVEVPVEGSAGALLAALADQGVVDSQVTLLSFHMEEGEDGTLEGSLDLSAEFQTQMDSTGSTGESALLHAVANTFLTHYGLERITITAGGSAIETGHNVYDEPITFRETY